MKITNEEIKKHCSPAIYKRGTEYLREGRVHLRKRGDDVINAVVDGERIYNVQIKTDGEKITDYFCTCPYYETMHTMCMHIVATMKQRMIELDSTEAAVDDNDIIANNMCAEYNISEKEKEQLHFRFVFYVNTEKDGAPEFSIEIETGEASERLQGIENFLANYISGNEFRINHHIKYSPSAMEFSENQKKIIGILAETYENHASAVPMYTKAAYRMTFGQLTAARILSFLANEDFLFVLNGMTVPEIRITEGDPDITTDINVTDSEIDMTVSERGFALTEDGSYFLYENTIFHTTPGWRAYFMPIYRAVSGRGRTRLTFRGENSILFAGNVLPEIRGKQGVVLNGTENLIIDEKPVFTVYLDRLGDGISAVITVNYGSVVLRLPYDSDEKKIVVRDYDAENDMLGFFSEFSSENGVYKLFDDERIFDFLTNDLTAVKKLATVLVSEKFSSFGISDDSQIAAKASFNKETDLLSVDFETNLSDDEIEGILNSVRLRRKFYRLKDGNFVKLAEKKNGDVIDILENLGFDKADIKGRHITVPKYDAWILNNSDVIAHDKSFSEYMDSVLNAEPNIPENLTNVLRDYQKIGIKWMKQLTTMGLGGILADDMGLGKTLQVLAFVHGEKFTEPSLIVTPSSLTYNWRHEANRFIPDASVIIIDGTKEERKQLIKDCGKYEFVITSYPSLRRDISFYEGMSFSLCVTDEAQYIKNPKTMSAKSVKKINAECKFALTGTPIENSLSELWSIFDFVMPGYLFGLSEFERRYGTPILRDGSKYEADMLRNHIRPFIMRRMKNDVLSELPEKIESTMYSDMTEEQKNMYISYLSLARKETEALIEEGATGKIRILTLLMRLRQICCHPSLFDKAYKKGSGKLELLKELISDAVYSEHRVLVFSQFTSMLAIIRKKLSDMELDYFYIDGSTPPEERTEFAAKFNAGEKKVFLISLKAGGTGLNLTGADTVIHYDPWWNPAAVDQASDRAYRIGQTRAVRVIRLAAKGTIEEKILQLQEQKRSLADDIISANGKTFADLTSDEILRLFNREEL